MKTISCGHKLLLCLLLLLTTHALKAVEGFSLIPAGPFTMGDSLDGIYDAPVRTVTLDAFYMGKNVVTWGEYQEVRIWAVNNGYTDLATGSGKAGNHPVHSISWYDMVKWCNARSEKDGLAPVYYTDDAQTVVYKTGTVNLNNTLVKWSTNGYRLPTEAEWEKAARGGLSSKRFPWGDTISHIQANYFSSSAYNYDVSPTRGYNITYHIPPGINTSPVGAFATNGYGLYDMAGNVWQWCWDRYGVYELVPISNPRGPDQGTSRVGRGGGWDWQEGAPYCRVASRDKDAPADSEYYIGFRLARSITADQSLVGKVMVGYWDERGSGVECHFFKNENELIFKDSEEHSVNEYAWDPEAGILNDYSFGEYFEIFFENPDSGTFTLYAENVQPSIGTFVIYDGSWDLDGNGRPDGKDIQLGKMLSIKHPLNLSSDEDKDGLDLAAEGRAGTNPKKFDSDDDGYPDGFEVASGSDPKSLKAIAAGGDASFYLDAEGCVWAVGDNEDGQLGDGTRITAYSPRLIMSEVKAISAGDGYTLMLKKNGTVWATGQNWAGQLGDGTQTDKTSPVQVMSNVYAISAGDEHSLFLKTDGTLLACGHNEDGQLGDGTSRTRTSPVKVMSDVKAMSAGGAFSIFLKTDGTAWASGENWAGQIGDGTYQSRITPVQIMSGVKAVAAGMDHGLYLKLDGSLWSVGGNWAGQLGDGTTTYQATPIKVFSNVMGMAAGDDFSAFITNEGDLFLAGDRGLGIQGIEPIKLMSDALAVSAGVDHLLILKTNGSIWAQGYNDSGALGSSDPPMLADPAVIMKGAKAVDAGAYHSLVLKQNGSAWAFGDNFYGTLGDGTFENRSTPVQVMSNVQAVATGEAHSVFLKSDGSVWISGVPLGTQIPDDYDFRYQDYREQSLVLASPERLMTGVKAIASGVSHSLFLKNDGSVWAAGANWAGQLGIGSNEDQTRAVKVMDGVKAIAAGDHHSFFLKNDGSLWGAGRNKEGQLGDGTLTDRKVPVFIMKDVKALSRPHAGDHSLFLKTDGSVWGTGRNSSGELGIGSYWPVNLPIKIMSGAIDMAVGSSHSFFLKADKTLWASGANESGQLGNGATNGSNVPTRVMSGVRSMSCGEIHSLILKEDGTVLACGNRYYGKLGDGYIHDEFLPVRSFNLAPKSPQTIGAFEAITSKKFGSAPFVVKRPVATSKLPVVLKVKSGPAKIKGNIVTLTGVGTVVLAANQAGNANYSAAKEMTISFKVTK